MLFEFKSRDPNNVKNKSDALFDIAIYGGGKPIRGDVSYFVSRLDEGLCAFPKLYLSPRDDQCYMDTGVHHIWRWTEVILCLILIRVYNIPVGNGHNIQVIGYGRASLPEQNACFLVFYTIPTNKFLHIVGSVQGGWLQHEGSYEKTISIICFAIDKLYAATAKKGHHKRGSKER